MAFRRLEPQEVRVVVSGGSAVADDAMRLAHDGAVESGFMEPTPSGRRFHASYLNPGSQFMVAYANDQPIASLSMIEDGPFGLPSDRAFVEELDHNRLRGDVLVEAGAFSIVREWRRQPQLIFGYMLGTAIRLNLHRGPERRFVFSAEPRQARLLAATFCGQSAGEPKLYLGAPATLVVTCPASQWAEHFTAPDASGPQRIVREHALDPDASWLECQPDDDWKAVLLPTLLSESGLEARLEAKMGVLREALRLSRPTPLHRVVV